MRGACARSFHSERPSRAPFSTSRACRLTYAELSSEAQLAAAAAAAGGGRGAPPGGGAYVLHNVLEFLYVSEYTNPDRVRGFRWWIGFRVWGDLGTACVTAADCTRQHLRTCHMTVSLDSPRQRTGRTWHAAHGTAASRRQPQPHD
jgi:hypothetical protein